MMLVSRRLTIALFIATLVTAATCPAFAQAKRTVVVSAGARSYSRVPVSVTLPEPKKKGWQSVVVTVAETGEVAASTAVVANDTPTVEVIWMVDDLAQGDSRAYKVAFSKEESAPPTVSFGEPEGGALSILIDDELFTDDVHQLLVG